MRDSIAKAHISYFAIPIGVATKQQERTSKFALSFEAFSIELGIDPI